MKKVYITGNVIKLKDGYIVIITNVRDNSDNPYFSWISFSASNVIGGTHYKTEMSTEFCYDECNNICDDPECSICNGTGKYIKTRYGMEDAKYLADNVKSYILKCLTKNFDF